MFSEMEVHVINQNTQNSGPNVPRAPRTGTSNRGFASMDPETQRRIASQGGKAAHLKGTAHEFSSEEARLAGRKGGQSRAYNASLLRQKQQSEKLGSNSEPVTGQ